LKVVPYTAGVIADSFLSFDEDKTCQLVTPETHVYGQPMFQQNQQVSGSYEVRTPYYRGVRCDVVDSTQRPVLGDVRTNIRLRNLATYGGNDQTSNIFEAAGDDFNFFFMIGPPPMCDIRNVTSTSTFPTGNTVVVNTKEVKAQNVGIDYIAFYPTSFDPSVKPSATPYAIAAGSPEVLAIPKNEGGKALVVPITDCSIEAGASSFLRIKVGDTSKIDIPAAEEYLRTLATISVITNAPLVE
jgi:hypothetical protein